MRRMPKRRSRPPLRRVLIVLLALVVVVLVAGQFLLPPVAERVARSQLDDPRAEVTIEAFPAWKLVFGHVDRLDVRTPTLAVEPDDLTSLLRRARKVDRGEIRIGTLDVENVHLRAVTATIDDGQVTASARLSIAELADQVPGGGTLVAEPPQPDGLPRLRATVTVLGVRTEVPIVIRAANGALEAAGDGGITSVIRITVFENEALQVDDVRGTVNGDQLLLRFRGTLR